MLYKEKVCCSCKTIFTYIDNRGYENWHRCNCKKADCTKYLCKKCYWKIIERPRVAQNPNSSHNIIKSMMKWRKGKLPKNSEKGKGFRMEQVIAKYIGKDNCNLVANNFNNRGFGLEGKIGVMSREPYYGDWIFGVGSKKKGRNMKDGRDIIYLVCMDKGYKNVKRLYRIPTTDIDYIQTIQIYGNNNSKWEQYRLRDEEVNKVNAIYHNMKIENCPILCEGE